MRFLPAAAVVPVLFLFFCTRPPRTLSDISPDFWGGIFSSGDLSSIKGGGEVFVSLEGERYPGSADVKWERSGNFRAQFYSPLGGVIASVEADSVDGSVFLEDREYRFGLDERMDSVPFSWGRDLTFRQFIRILTGRMPLSPEGGSPDTIIISKKYAEAVWKRGELEISAKVNRRNELLDEVQYRCEKEWSIRMSRFYMKLARSIELREDDRNYFWIKYQNLRPE
ncbi:MAG: hypothetical protein GX089_13345 [Fibrobacter sp.]|jgi:hypothetical protein|nr:hypothetical protein [Fibrobacter sp.]